MDSAEIQRLSDEVTAARQAWTLASVELSLVLEQYSHLGLLPNSDGSLLKARQRETECLNRLLKALKSHGDALVKRTPARAETLNRIPPE